MTTHTASFDEVYDFSKRSTLKAACVWGLAAVFYLYELMLLVSPSVMHDDLTLAFNTTAEQLGNLAAFYYYAYAAMQIPVGLLMDKYGPRILLTVASLLCFLGCMVFGSAQVLWMAELGRFIMGLGGSFAVVGCLKLASLWFPVNRFALLTGFMVAVGMMGGVFGQAPVAKLVMAFGWQHTIYMGGILGAILSIIIWFVISDFPPGTAIHLTRHTPYGRKLFQGLLTVMRSPQVWVASLFAGLMFVPTTGFGQLWGVPYFSERFQIEKDVSGLLVSMIFFGWALGGPFYGWISDKVGRRKIPMGIAAVTTLVVMLAILNLDVSINGMRVLMFLLGVCSSGFILAFSVVREINTPLLTGTAIGFINTLNNASGALAQPIVGKILDKLWDETYRLDGSPVYTVDAYNTALMFLPVCLLIALLLVPFIRETYCKPQVTRLD